MHWFLKELFQIIFHLTLRAMRHNESKIMKKSAILGRFASYLCIIGWNQHFNVNTTSIVVYFAFFSFLELFFRSIIHQFVTQSRDSLSFYGKEFAHCELCALSQ